MTPVGERPGGVDPMPRYHVTCSCGVDEDVFGYVRECTRADEHEDGRIYEFACSYAGPAR